MESISNKSASSTIFPEPKDMYVAQLTTLQEKAHQIAREHLKTSFDISRSNGFIQWKKGASFHFK